MAVQLQIVPDAATVHTEFAVTIAAEIAENNAQGKQTRLILPVGPVAHYPILSRICNANQISWRNVAFTIMDEYLDWTGRLIPRSHPLSFVGFMAKFIKSLDTELRPHSEAWVYPDPFEINRVEYFVRRIGGIDTCYGGIGVHGHLAFNEPVLGRFTKVSEKEFLDSPTRVVALAPETMVMNATRANGGQFDNFPPFAVTIGMREILNSTRIRLFCDGGGWQQEAIARAIVGPASQEYPVSLLNNHVDAVICADELSAKSARERGAVTTNLMGS